MNAMAGIEEATVREGADRAWYAMTLAYEGRVMVAHETLATLPSRFRLGGGEALLAAYGKRIERMATAGRAERKDPARVREAYRLLTGIDAGALPDGRSHAAQSPLQDVIRRNVAQAERIIHGCRRLENTLLLERRLDDYTGEVMRERGKDLLSCDPAVDYAAGVTLSVRISCFEMLREEARGYLASTGSAKPS